MSAEAAPPAHPRRDARARVRIPLAAAVLFATYLFASFVLSGGTDVRHFSSGIYDMDVSRVISDLATDAPAKRQSVHPLQKILIAPLGHALNRVFFLGDDPLGATRVLIAVFMTFQSFGAGWLAWQLARRSRSAGVAATVLCAFSFSTWLAASIPESAAVASVATLLPLLYLNARWRRAFTGLEVVIWAVLGATALGLTLTQIVHVVIALVVRATWGRPAPGAGEPAALAPRLALVVPLLALLVWGGLALQERVYPVAADEPHESDLTVELHFLRTDALAAAPIAHVGRLLVHFALLDFVAPYPGYSNFLIRDYGLRYWSLSIEDVERARWTPPQVALAFATVLALLAACTGFRRGDARFVAPALCVASQLALHVMYGREYVIYSPHWHGAWVALLVAAAWRAFPRRHRAMLVPATLLGIGMLANDVAVMQRTYQEVDTGLHVWERKIDGSPLHSR